MATGCILLHDLLIQARYFNTVSIDVSGNQRLTPDVVTRIADLQTGRNILAVNLAVARKRLEAHPWIERAAVSRVLPGRIAVSISEHRAIARIEVAGGEYLMNTHGALFKAVDGDDPPDLPQVRGFTVQDIRQKHKAINTPFGAVFWLLSKEEYAPAWLGGHPMGTIAVDPELGVTVKSTEPDSPEIQAGFGPYYQKWQQLSEVWAYAAAHQMANRITQINLRTPNRIVIRLTPIDPDALEKKEA